MAGGYPVDEPARGSRQSRSRACHAVAHCRCQLRFFDDFLFRVAAAHISALKAASLILSPAWISIARLVLPARLALNNPAGSSSEAPLAKVSFTMLFVRFAGADQSIVRPNRNTSSTSTPRPRQGPPA